ncbi:hypothetical protein [Vibrio hyugaensis]|uniref:Uncharacterized protein n=2 Tax=Vibrio hyugaensis TaxID=1534743 RepID=A0ABQ5Y255_9VIBR|nr:hypothetical protein [Vibrio hyugaensis]GLR04814.1 hypothetical protein GCM10007906_24020 [Vibrio hyugaensis]
MKKIATIAVLALMISFAATAQAANPEEMSNSALMECANASNVRIAIPEHRAMFRHYLMAKRGYTFSQLSSAETEFKAKGMDKTKVEQLYNRECKEAGEYLYNNGY